MSSEAPPPDDSGSSSSSSSTESPPPPPKSSDSASPPTKSNSNKNYDSGSNGGGGSSWSFSSGGSPPPPVNPSPTSRNEGGGSSPPAPKSAKSSSSHGSTDQQESSTKSGSSKSDSGNSSSENDSGPDGTLIAGVAVGAGLLIMILICCIARCTRKKKKKKQPYDYHDGRGGGQYNETGEWQNGYPNQGYNQGVPPPPPPQSGPGMMQMPSSGEVSGNYSGPYRPPMPPPSPNIALGFNKSTFSFEELSAATNGFSEANVLGQGGFGFVHKGVLPNGKEIAVKSLKSGSGQGEREFQAEVEIISRVHHRHLVSLVGYCIAGVQRMLVYEFVSNNNLEYHLHGKGRPIMDFGTRVRIALGSAKGLAYLHEDCHPRIIHRDIKAANILLDNNFEAMVADFGLAKLSSDTHTHVSTRVMGTFGYLAPEYASSGKLTEKSDVFSFGVMLLELITGRRPVDPYDVMDDSLVDWARPLMGKALEDGNYDELADARLERVYNPQDMQRMIACASASIRHSARKRPRMSQIVRALEGDSSLDDLNDAPRAGQVASGYGSSNSLASGDYSQSTYQADMQKFRQLALASQEFGSEKSSNDSSEMGTRSKF